MDRESRAEAGASSFEKVKVSEFDELGVVKLEFGIKGDKVENGGQKIYRHASSVDGNEYLNGCFDSKVDRRVVCSTTPSPDRENLELSSSSDQSEELDSVSSCHTPKENIFNPFAPGPEELAFAPKKKILKETLVSLRRQLIFSDCGDPIHNAIDLVPEDAGEEEDQLLEMLFESFLELIVSSQLQEMSSIKFPNECFKTPSSQPFLTGIAETCPPAPAPKRQIVKRRECFVLPLCRKLEFRTDLS